MFSIFAQTASVSVSESQNQPTDAGKNSSGPALGYTSCTIA
nr:mating factor a1.2 [Moesziomyces parantarcticus]